jgi:ABC-2 type transport system permease protein
MSALPSPGLAPSNQRDYPDAPPRPTLASQLRALAAVARKDWTIFRRYPSWIVAVLVWPTFLPLGYIFSARAFGGPNGTALGTFARLSGTTDYAAFILVGSALWGWLNLTLWDVGYQLRSEQLQGTLESNWLCPVWRISIILGGSLTKLGTSVLFLAITVLEFQLVFGVKLLQGNLPLALLVLGLVIPSIYGIGIAFGSVVVRFKEPHTLVFFVRGIFMIFCGMTYPMAVLPDWMQRAADYLPLTYAIRDIRAAVLSNATAGDLASDLQRLVIFAVALPVLGYLGFRLTERQARRDGTLANY